MDLEKRMSLVAAKSWGYVYQNGSLHYPSFLKKKEKRYGSQRSCFYHV